MRLYSVRHDVVYVRDASQLLRSVTMTYSKQASAAESGDPLADQLRKKTLHKHPFFANKQQLYEDSFENNVKQRIFVCCFT